MSTLAMISIALGFSAKEMCSCFFVSHRTEPQCRQYVALEQLKPTIKIDSKNKTVKASYYFVFSQTAKYEGERFGCALK